MLGAQNLEQARAWFFYVFTSVETVLLTSRYMMERGAGFTPSGWTWTISGMLPDPFRGYSRHALRYAQIFTTFSPYGPRPRRSARLILGWMVVLILILALTFYLTSRDGEPSKLDTKVVMDQIRGRARSLREKTSKAVP
ncbi:hypothetical protein NUW58_g3904 [Xylaria curta]|uniref:Uncharacterized protein n=1 Tax=Xylaria curta TaxID=42375 RepID=A0ACC1PAG3_9PEZI|nr:hypothetical protein NUW58_g3904 [Xylaria curta]